MVDISEQDREYFHAEVMENTKPSKKAKKEKSRDSALSITKVFLYMGLGLLITTIVAFGVGAIVYYQFNLGSHDPDAVLNTYLIVTIASAFALIIDMIIINVMVARGRHSILVPGIIYAILVGVMFSMLTIVVDWRLLGMAFAITTLSFFLMGLISFLSKGNMAPLLVLIIGLSMGVAFLALFTWIFALISSTVFNTLFFVLSIMVLALLMFVTMFDMWRIKQIADNGAMSNNVTLYCAFIMYTDFINVFIRILYFLIIIAAKSKR